MKTLPQWMNSEPLPSPWPDDRYELRCALPAPFFATNDRYHFPAHAYEAMRRIQQEGQAMEIQVIRLGDGAVLFDLLAGIDIPLSEW
ncbi:hypothetical protein AB0K60_26145 [Thermopolyspora sp. NPDC052614]|uniref:hypothetical protein n=1 Tax=Thermopolyspora sp. NPDC052614 TaxID=3155682 RepID=UPI00342163F9